MTILPLMLPAVPPICRPGLQHIHGVSKRETAAILCDVIANPAKVRFQWTFNNTSEWHELDSRLVNSSETRSTLRYRPRTEMDYGTVFCWATNDIGRMATPCVFHIIAAGEKRIAENGRAVKVGTGIGYVSGEVVLQGVKVETLVKC